MTPNIRRRSNPNVAAQHHDASSTPEEINRADALELKIVYQPSDKLVLAAREVRKHSKKQVAQIEASMRRFGNMQPIIVDQDNNIVCGVGRFLAARNLKLRSVPTICANHLSPMEIRAFGLADNKIAEGASWNRDALAIEITELMVADFEIELTGFNMVEIESLALTAAEAKSEETEEIPEPEPGPPVSQPGDVYGVGNHMLACGDARDETVYAALMGGEKARMVFADLPYNVRIANNVSGLGKVKHGEFVAGSGEMTPDAFTVFMAAIMARVDAHSMDGSIQYLCMDWRHQLEMMQAGNQVYTELKNLLVWVKTNGGMSAFYRSQHELIYVWKSGTARHVNNFGLGENGRYRTNVLTYPGCNTFRKGREEDLELHSTVKPTQLVADLIRDVSKIGEIVLDPCSGSGTTILAAERVQRRARCIELDPKYVDATLRRCQDKLGITPVHLATGMTFDELTAHRRGDTAGQEKGQ